MAMNFLSVMECFLHVENFFGDPLPSSDLGIFFACNLSGKLEIGVLNEIQRKYVMFPYKMGNVLVPLGHVQL